jgi:hypothetical protein
MAKFTIDEVLESIKAQFTNAEGKTSLQISDRTITETLNPFLALVGEEMEVSEFVEKYGKGAVDSANRNLIKLNSDFAKNYKPTPNDPPKKQEPFDMEAFFAKFAETQQKSITDAMAPLRAELDTLKQEKNAKIRTEQVLVKKDALKLTRSWSVDFDNSIEYAELVLGKDATADQIYEKAYEHFNKTLTSRGETYKPQESGVGSGTKTFDAIKAKLEAEKNKKK